MIWFGLAVGSTIGGFIPSIWGAAVLSFSGLIFSALGGFVGIWLGFRLGA